MTQEEKARAYDAALERARELHDVGNALTKMQLGIVFPQLVESEDERIRIAIESIIHVYGKTQGEWIAGYDMDTLVVHLRNAFAYLEKQKEQKPAEVDESTKRLNENWMKQYFDEQKPTEWSEDKFPKDIEKDATQFCFDKGINITPHQAKEIATHYLMVGHNEGYVEGRKNAHIPAKELGLPSSMDFKQEWSEEDEEMLEYIIYDVNDAKQLYTTQAAKDMADKEIEWLKSLRPQPKQEWSEEEKDKVAQYLHDKDGGMLWSKATEITSDILDILHPRPSWKPSEEQMKALNAISCHGELTYTNQGQILIDLYNDLKKLNSE